MAIIEGLQAAWGTISRILQAISKFVDFLKAVKTGGAGPKFADALAAAAIVVIDFVANWLLKKLRGPASKIGGKIKAIAKKILEKLKAVAKKIGRAVKKAVKKIAGKIKKGLRKVKEKLFGKKKKGKAKRKDDENKKKKKEKKVQEAIAKTKAAVEGMLARGTRPLVMKVRLAYLKMRYGWQQLSLEKEGGSFRVRGHINPDFDLPANVSFEELTVNVSDLGLSSKAMAGQGATVDRPLPKDAYVGGMSPSGFAQEAILGGILAGEVPDIPSGPITNLKGKSKGALKPPKAPKPGSRAKPDPKLEAGATLFLGERQYPTKDPIVAGNLPKPDAVILQNDPSGQLVSAINIEATLDGKLMQGHKETQLYRTIIAAQDVFGRYPNVSPNLVIHYIIIAPSEAEGAKTKLQNQFTALEGKVHRPVKVTWVFIKGL
jgi:hypothetical protein